MAEDTIRKRVLSIGGGKKSVPPLYETWSYEVLDIDPDTKPDILMNACNLHELEAEQYDAVYSSHSLEHFYEYQAKKLLKDMYNVLKPDGFAEIWVPDLFAAISHVVKEGLGFNDTLIISKKGPISLHDMMYGFGEKLEEQKTDYYAHKAGYSREKLIAFCNEAGFNTTIPIQNVEEAHFNLGLLLLKTNMTKEQQAFFGTSEENIKVINELPEGVKN